MFVNNKIIMDELTQPKYSDKYPEYMNVSCQKANTGDSFPLGVQSYKFSVGSGTWWLPEKTHFVMRITLENGAGGLLGDTPETALCAPTMGLMSTLFQNIQFNIGGQCVQKLSNYVAQVDSLIHRTSNSKPYIDSIGEASNFWSESFSVRQAEIGDTTVDGRKALKFDLIFKPPLSLFHDNGGEPLPAATDYEILLTPQPPSQYKIGVIETKLGAGDVPLSPGLTANDYNFTVDQLELEVATVEGPVFDSGTFKMRLANIECQVAKVQTSSLSQTYFTVHPKTSALCIAYQDTRLANAYVSRTKFIVAPNSGAAYDPAKVSDNKALGLNRLFVQFDSLTRPTPDANPEYDALSVDRTVQRYYESMSECNLLHNPAGTESLQEFHRRGDFYYFNWGRKATGNGKTSGATRVQVNQQFQSGTPVENMNVLLFSVHRNDVSVTVKSGQTMGISIE